MDEEKIDTHIVQKYAIDKDLISWQVNPWNVNNMSTIDNGYENSYTWKKSRQEQTYRFERINMRALIRLQNKHITSDK